MRDIVSKLAVSMPKPADDAADETWDTWMKLADIDSMLAGMLSTFDADGRINRTHAQEALDALLAHPEWRDVDIGSDRYDTLLQAARVLLEN